MNAEASLFAALLLGLAGSSHCIFMCGGIHGGMVTASRQGKRYMPWFNLGRVASYTFFGLLAGSLGLVLQLSGDAMSIAKIVAGVLLLAMAVYIGQWWKGLVVLEKIGAPLWQIVQPFAKQLTPVNSLPRALFAGAVWGWLPCGLVYSTLAWAMLAGNPAESAGRMLFFGLGTIPAMLGTGFIAERFATYLKSRAAINLNAALLVLFALWTMLPGIQALVSPGESGHGSHQHMHH